MACYLVSGLLLLVAFRPRIALYVSYGWTFAESKEPSARFSDVSAIGCLTVAVLVAVIGTVVLAKSSIHDAKVDAYLRCELERAFTGAIRWDATRLADPDALRDLARELRVQLTIESRSDDRDSCDEVAVFDPAHSQEQPAFFSAAS